MNNISLINNKYYITFSENRTLSYDESLLLLRLNLLLDTLEPYLFPYFRKSRQGDDLYEMCQGMLLCIANTFCLPWNRNKQGIHFGNDPIENRLPPTWKNVYKTREYICINSRAVPRDKFSKTIDSKGILQTKIMWTPQANSWFPFILYVFPRTCKTWIAVSTVFNLYTKKTFNLPRISSLEVFSFP